MQDYLNFILEYWYIFLPLVIVIIIAGWYLVRKGYLHEIDLFGLKLNFNGELSDGSKYIDNPRVKSPKLRDYEIKFSQTALENISFLRITQELVIKLVESEFTHHVNYFKWDLLDYPLPVQDGYIVVLDKVGRVVTFRSVKRADFNELELASLNDILSIYRRLSRFEYRLDKNFILRSEMVFVIAEQHEEVIRRLIRHHEIFRQISLPGKEKFPSMFLSYLSDSAKSVESESRLKEFERKIPPTSKGFGLNVVSSISALQSIDEIITNEENGLISQKEADKEVVLCLERSLQYIHKMINVCLE